MFHRESQKRNQNVAPLQRQSSLHQQLLPDTSKHLPSHGASHDAEKIPLKEPSLILMIAFHQIPKSSATLTL